MQGIRLMILSLLVGLAVPGFAELPIDGRIVAITGEEALSTPYRFQIDIDANNFTGSLAQLVDTPASFPLPGGRVVKGVVESAAAVRRTRNGILYRIEVVPRLADGGHGQRYRTFEEMKVSDITEQLMQQLGQVASVDSSQLTHEIVLQMGESDLDFLRRLLEREGGYFFFDTANHKATFTFNSVSAPAAGGVLNMQGEKPSLINLAYGFSKHSGRVQLNSYEFKNANANMGAVAQTSRYQSLIYDDQQADYSAPGEGASVASRVLAAHVAQGLTVDGRSRSSQVSPGYTIDVKGHPVADANQRYLILSVNHRFRKGNYENSFTALPAAVPYQPLPTTTETGVVIATAVVIPFEGGSGYVDEFGRVKLKFPGNSHGLNGVKARVVQPNSYSIWLPEVDDEVVVAFVNGRDTQPVVLGTLFNSHNESPYPLPDSKSVSALGAVTGGPRINEIMFGGQGGSELVRVTAAKDLHTDAANDHSANVGHDQSVSVVRNQNFSVGGDQKTSVGGNKNTSVAGKHRVDANVVEIRGQNSIVFRVGNQTMVLDQNGIQMPTAASQATRKTPPVPVQNRLVKPRPPKK